MIDELGGVTAAAVKLALDAAVIRHHVIANNVANAETPGYKPTRLSFDERLSAAQAAFLDLSDDDALRTRVAELEERLAAPGAIRRSGAGAVEIDAQMIALADNTIRYQALLEGLAKQMAIVRAAISEGRP